jgi:hypothetical protein
MCVGSYLKQRFDGSAIVPGYFVSSNSITKSDDLSMSSAPLPPLLARPDRGAPLRARETVLNDPGCLRTILAFVPDSYRFVAPVSQIFFHQYMAAHHDSTRTLLRHAAATPRTAQVWIDGGPQFMPRFWLDDRRPFLPLALMAARWGRLDVLIYLHDHGGWQPNPQRSTGRDIGVAAASSGHSHVLEWALSNELVVWDDSISNAVAMNGHLHVLQLARDRGHPLCGEELYYSVENGHLNVVIWLHEQGIEILETGNCSHAASAGHLHVLQWLRANECPWDTQTCEHAAEGGHLHILQWARANGCLCDENTCTCAAAEGDLPMLQWASANDCPWDASTCYWAARNGHLHVLQWAIDNGCPWHVAHCLQSAARSGHTEIIEWINGNGGLGGL